MGVMLRVETAIGVGRLRSAGRQLCVAAHRWRHHPLEPAAEQQPCERQRLRLHRLQLLEEP
jgi:hypothetical protein